MSILILCIIVLIIAGLFIYAVDLVPIPAPMNGFVKLLIIILAILVIVEKTHLL